MKFNEKPSSGSRVVSGGRTDGRRDIAKVTVAFHNFAKAFRTGEASESADIFPTLSFEPGTKGINSGLKSYSDVALRSWESHS
jgi:hypothetical protein